MKNFPIQPKKESNPYEKDDAIFEVWRKDVLGRGRIALSSMKGKTIEVEARQTNHIANLVYYVFLDNVEVGYFYVSRPIGGQIQITNAGINRDGKFDDEEVKNYGIGSAVYGLIENDILKSGGNGLTPHWGSMSDDAIHLWAKRLNTTFEKISDANEKYLTTFIQPNMDDIRDSV